MPIYEYKCKNCGKTTEIIQLSGEMVSHCPHCGSKDIERIPSAANCVSSPSKNSSICQNTSCSQYRGEDIGCDCCPPRTDD